MGSEMCIRDRRLVNGFAYGMTSTATNAIVTDYIPEDKKGLGINFYGLSTSLAAAIGPFVGMILLNLTNFRFIVIVSSVLILLTTIATLLLPIHNLALTPERKAELRHMTFDNLIERKALFIAGIGFLMGFSYSSVLSFLSSYAKTIHLVSISSFFFVVYALVITFTRPMAGRIFDTRGEDYVMYPAYASLAVGLVLLGVTHSGFMLLLSGAFICLLYTSDAADEEDRVDFGGRRIIKKKHTKRGAVNANKWAHQHLTSTL